MTTPYEEAGLLGTDAATPSFGAFTGSDPGAVDDLSAADFSSTSGIPHDFDPAAVLKPGEIVFDRYIVERKLGEGGMGTVWLVRHREFDSERALKLIVSGIARDQQARARFRREARILDRLNHPNAVRVYDARLGKDIAFIEMEYVRGTSLNQVLEPGKPMPLEWVADLLSQLCDVLQAANDEGIIHRDLKPPNLMLVDGRQPGSKVLKLLDFGIAKMREGGDDVRTVTGSFMGTPLYSSPEQIVGERVDARSDIYAVGLILYELLTGHRPFEGSINAIIYKHTMVPPPPFQEINPAVSVPPAVEAVVQKCLAKEPEQRPQTPRALAEMFHAAIAGIPPDAAAPQGAAKASQFLTQTFETGTERKGRAGTWLRVATALLALGLIVLLLAVVGLRRDTSPRPPAAPGSPAKSAESAPAPVAKKSPRTADPAAIAAQEKLWNSRGYVVDGSVPRTAGGWPAVLIRSADNTKFQRDLSGLYLPPGFAPSSERAEDGYPRTIESEDHVTFARIVGGTFVMGTLRAVDAVSDEEKKAVRLVQLSSFYMQQTEVTNGEIQPFMNTLDPQVCKEWRTTYDTRKSPAKGPGPDLARRYPATCIPWRVAADFARSKGKRLPTEAQWEYAARSQGQPNVHVWGNGEVPPGEPANINYKKQEPQPVGSYDQDITDQGIRDMTGNVREWCRDVSKPLEPSAAPVVDPSFPPPSAATSDGLEMVVRGGSYLTGFESGRTTAREEPRKGGVVTDEIGFRTVVECPEGPPDLP